MIDQCRPGRAFGLVDKTKFPTNMSWSRTATVKQLFMQFSCSSNTDFFQAASKLLCQAHKKSNLTSHLKYGLLVLAGMELCKSTMSLL